MYTSSRVFRLPFDHDTPATMLRTPRATSRGETGGHSFASACGGTHERFAAPRGAVGGRALLCADQGQGGKRPGNPVRVGSQLPDDAARRVSRREHGRRQELEGTHLRVPPQGRHAPVRVRCERHVRQGMGRGRLRNGVRAQGARRPPGQRLGRGRGDEHDHQVQPRRPRGAGAGPPTRSRRRRRGNAARRSASGRALPVCPSHRRRVGSAGEHLHP